MTAVYDSDEARIFAMEIRDVETTESLSMLAGRAVPYNTRMDLPTFSEEVRQGAFNRSIRSDAQRLPLHLFHGDAIREGGHPSTPWPIGMSHEWSDEPDGLHGVWRLDTGAEAQRAAQLARDGMLPYLSVRFTPMPNKTQIEYNSDKPHLIRQQARLVSTSLVSTPAYATAGVEWVRSAETVATPGSPGTALARWTEYLEKIRQGPIRG